MIAALRYAYVALVLTGLGRGGAGCAQGSWSIQHRGDITGRTPAEIVADGITFVPQGHGIFRTLSVRDNLELGAFVLQGQQPDRRAAGGGFRPALDPQ